MIAAGQRGDRIAEAAEFRFHLPRQRADLVQHVAVSDAQPAAETIKRRQRGVLGDGQKRKDALLLAFFGKIDQPGPDGVQRRPEAGLAPFQRDRAGIGSGGAEKTFRHFAAPRSDQARDAEYLALAKRERDIAEFMLAAKVPDVQNDLCLIQMPDRLPAGFWRTSGHQRDHAFACGLLRWDGADIHAVAQDGDPL